ncbi:hypothetical protein CEXT_649321 [Caerostris extrusa]|uniref:Uncharacterized protein n=1 Tax=Caerostris extrusa TaxID=172846 RepID=A0AAV4XZK0_CAEEX|nr:hypothetical protein CEXT_649321 [Caerostris extrusa]
MLWSSPVMAHSALMRGRDRAVTLSQQREMDRLSEIAVRAMTAGAVPSLIRMSQLQQQATDKPSGWKTVLMLVMYCQN